MEAKLSHVGDNAESAVEALEFCSRTVSHSVRKYLGILLPFVDDICCGQRLSAEDMDYAGQAIEQMRNLADFLRDIGLTRTSDLEEINLKDEVELVLAEKWAALYQIKSDRSTCSESKKIDRLLFVKAFRCALRFAVSQCLGYKEDISNNLFVIVKQECGHDKIHIALPPHLGMEDKADLLSLAKKKRVVESVGLVMTDLAMKLLGGEARIVSGDSGVFLEMSL